MNLEYILSQKSNYNGLLIDTNLLLLLLIGLFDKSQINKNKRTIKYNVGDFEKLKNLLNHFATKFLITPNVLTELCNLGENYNDETDLKFFLFVKEFLNNCNEDNKKSLEIIDKDQTVFYKFGIADASISYLAEQNTLIVTDDLKLYHYLISKKYSAINYTHLMVL